MARRVAAPLRIICRSFSSGHGGGKIPQAPVNVISNFATAPSPKPEASSVDKKFQVPPLSQPLPGLPSAIYAQPPKTDPYVTTVTTLNSGIKVASEAKFGEYCTVGVTIDAGCRYEVAYPSGICHFLEKLAFNSTEKYGTREEVYAELERHGAICDAHITKDTALYAASCRPSGLDQVVGLIADAVLRPRILDEEVELARSVVKFDVEDMNSKPECEMILMDWIHTAAYRDNTLGLPKYCPLDNLEKIKRETLFSFLKTYFIPKRMVFAGVGVSHDDLVKAVKKHFEEIPAVWDSDATITLTEPPTADESVAQYTGGIVKVEKDLSDISLGPTPYPNLAHIVLGLESSSFLDDDFVSFCVLNALMGGGSSFSAGGPGKGMYTRLYLDVLNKYDWIHSATSYNHCYADTGLFCIHASCHPDLLDKAAVIVVNQFLQLADQLSPGKGELDRAKTQLKSMLMMNLEQRPVMFEDVGRQVLGHGHRKSPLEYVEKIDKISAKDIQRVGERLLSSKAAVVGYGKLDRLPSYETIDAAVAKKEPLSIGRKRFSLFGKK